MKRRHVTGPQGRIGQPGRRLHPTRLLHSTLELSEDAIAISASYWTEIFDNSSEATDLRTFLARPRLDLAYRRWPICRRQARMGRFRTSAPGRIRTCDHRFRKLF